jgi:hypothetical protein
VTALRDIRRAFPIGCSVLYQTVDMIRPGNAVVAGYGRHDRAAGLLLFYGPSNSYWTTSPSQCQRMALKVAIGPHVKTRRGWGLKRNNEGRYGDLDNYVKAHAREHGFAMIIEGSDAGIAWRMAGGQLKRENIHAVETIRNA